MQPLTKTIWMRASTLGTATIPQGAISIGLVNVHGYSNGTEPYRGPNPELDRARWEQALWQSEYGDGDASGYTMAQELIRDMRELRPSAWIYWQPVEPDAPDGYGWGLINSSYIDTHDQPSAEKTPLIRVNRKFYVYGQFTRYIRQGYRIVELDDPNSIAAYDAVRKSSP